MEIVQPIREKESITNIKNFFEDKKNKRDLLLFTLGINSGLRISDLLKLKVEDIDKNRVIIREQKTQKTKDFKLNQECRRVLNEYLSETGMTSGFLFASQKGGTPITRQHAHRILNEAKKKCGIIEKIGCHTLRKTFGYHLYKTGIDITRIQKLLNHSSPSITLSYIGITRDELDEIVENLNL